ncbi:DNA repair exonuclease [Bordetella genomosp. 1]|uniref:DNA repair exonuclease n=1 Tax=Bordetella genomosp. 1 TaxID=1395607 RepID=A0A261SHH6_9BORD|nr:DNA repair exonuclease [Bordetella genomosp. 1]OZI35813.1 DNA repair exonuclease [Bordetella genomosp. 1]
MTHFLHTADWQIGRVYGQFDTDDAAVLAEARLETVARIAALAHERRVDAVLVAGDVFDTQAVSDRSIRRLFDALAAYTGPWVMIAGNHDAALADSVWSRARQLGCVPPNVHIPDTTQVVVLDTLCVLAAPLTQRHTYDDVTAAFDHLDSPAGLPRVGLAHGSVSGRLPESADAANPIDPERTTRARLDYLALGDWHGCLEIEARTWYAGTPEQDRFRGNEPGQVLDVVIGAPGQAPQVTRVPVGRFRWQQWQATLGLESDTEALAVRLAGLGADDVLRLELAGQVTLAGWERVQQAIGQAEARARSLSVDATALTVAPADADLAALQLDGYVADVADRLRAMQDGPDAAVARTALRLLLSFQRAQSREAA